MIALFCVSVYDAIDFYPMWEQIVCYVCYFDTSQPFELFFVSLYFVSMGALLMYYLLLLFGKHEVQLLI